ncbi:MAG: hypothetical protein ACYTG6_14420, partial [Planctomycetota bacterium]
MTRLLALVPILLALFATHQRPDENPWISGRFMQRPVPTHEHGGAPPSWNDPSVQYQCRSGKNEHDTW